MLRRGEIWRIDGARERLGLVISSDVYNSTDVPIVIVAEVVDESLLRDSPARGDDGPLRGDARPALRTDEEVVHRVRGRGRHRDHAAGRPGAAHPPGDLTASPPVRGGRAIPVSGTTRDGHRRETARS